MNEIQITVDKPSIIVIGKLDGKPFNIRILENSSVQTTETTKTFETFEFSKTSDPKVLHKEKESIITKAKEYMQHGNGVRAELLNNIELAKKALKKAQDEFIGVVNEEQIKNSSYIWENDVACDDCKQKASHIIDGIESGGFELLTWMDMEFLNKKCPHVGQPKALYDSQTSKSVETAKTSKNPFLSFKGLKRPAPTDEQTPQAFQISQISPISKETNFPDLESFASETLEALEAVEPLEPLEPLETLKISKPGKVPDSYKNIKLDEWSTKNPRMVERIDTDVNDDDTDNLYKEIHRMNEIGMINTLRERSTKQREELEKQIEQDEIQETMKTQVVNRKQAMSYIPFNEPERKQIVLDRAEIAKMTPEQIFALFNP